MLFRQVGDSVSCHLLLIGAPLYPSLWTRTQLSLLFIGSMRGTLRPRKRAVVSWSTIWCTTLCAESFGFSTFSVAISCGWFVGPSVCLNFASLCIETKYSCSTCPVNRYTATILPALHLPSIPTAVFICHNDAFVCTEHVIDHLSFVMLQIRGRGSKIRMPACGCPQCRTFPVAALSVGVAISPTLLLKHSMVCTEVFSCVAIFEIGFCSNWVESCTMNNDFIHPREPPSGVPVFVFFYYLCFHTCVLSSHTQTVLGTIRTRACIAIILQYVPGILYVHTRVGRIFNILYRVPIAILVGTGTGLHAPSMSMSFVVLDRTRRHSYQYPSAYSTRTCAQALTRILDWWLWIRIRIQILVLSILEDYTVLVHISTRNVEHARNRRFVGQKSTRRIEVL